MLANSDKYNNVKVSELESIDITQITIKLIFTELAVPQIEEDSNYIKEDKILVG